MKKRLIVVDISGFIFRAFYAIRPLHSPDGTPVNAVHGILSMLMKMMSKHRSTHLILAKDSKAKTFRKEIYPEYKANRKETPEDLIPQFELIDKLVDKMKLPSIISDGYEADDIIGSLVTQWEDEFEEILIASSDKDLMQFVSDKVKMLDTMKEITYGRDEVFEKMGVWPEQIIDYLSILGDASDNIPGMKGIGAKGASKLLGEYKTLEKCIENKDVFTNKRVKNAFLNHIGDAILSKKLIKIVTDLPLGKEVSDSEYSFKPTTDLKDFLKDLGFKSAVKKIEDLDYIDSSVKGRSTELLKQVQVNSKFNFTTDLIDKNGLNSILDKIKSSNILSAAIDYKSDQFYTEENLLRSITVNFDGLHSYCIINQTNSDFLKVLKAIWEVKNRRIIGFNLKRDFLYLNILGVKISADYDDIAQLYFILNPDSRCTLENAVSRYLASTIGDYATFSKKYDDLTDDDKANFLGGRTAYLIHLEKEFMIDLKKNAMGSIYFEMDKPLIPVLAQMEFEGIRLNPPYFSKLEVDLEKRILDIEKKIEQESGESINLRSPKQLRELLFEKMNLPVIKKTKTGASTDVEVLEELVSRDLSEVPKLILSFREYDKILSTYVKALPKLIEEKTGKLHTHFNQNVAATGRLSSDRPNLQNIPIRTEEGRKIRKGFISSPGWMFLSADYSQVELRILAHFSRDPIMVNSFLNGVDIHTQTACEVLKKSKSELEANDRTIAKAVNFGLMYGQSSFGLGRSLGIDLKEAKEFITRYFERFSAVKIYIDELKERCMDKGYSITMHGRRRRISNINASNRMIKAQAERAAINSPIQGTAADIIKIAMLSLSKKLKEMNLKSKMILQVHDELIFEVPDAEVKIMKDLVRREMEGAVKLEVPLDVNISIGVNWFDLK